MEFGKEMDKFGDVESWLDNVGCVGAVCQSMLHERK